MNRHGLGCICDECQENLRMNIQCPKCGELKRGMYFTTEGNSRLLQRMF